MCYDPGDHLKKCRSPDLEKCRKSASESAGPKRGAEESAEKGAAGSVSCTASTRRRNPEHFLRHFPRHPVSGQHFPKHFFGTFPGRGLGTSLDGRQDRNSCGDVGSLALYGGTFARSYSVSKRAKRAEKASCGETVVQKGVVGESVFFLCPLKVCP